MTNGTNGNGHDTRAQRNLELRSRKLLQASGFRTMQTKDDLFDLVAVGVEGVVFVKVQDNELTDAARERLEAFRVPTGTVKLVHCWRRFQRIPLVQVVV